MEAYSAIIRESTSAQEGLRKEFKRRAYRADWTAWNVALAMISLVGSSELVSSAHEMDTAMWKASRAVAYGNVTSDEEWDEFREGLEATRLAFLNAAQRAIAKDVSVIDRIVSRPPVAELGQRLAQPAEAD